MAFVALGAWVGTWAVVTADVEADLGLGHGGFGLVLAVALAGSGGANAVAGSLAERWGSRRLLQVGLVAFAAMVVLVAAGTTPVLLGVAVVAAITFGGAVDVAMNVSAAAALAERPGGLVRFHGLFNVGAVLGAGAAGIALRLGWSWRTALALPVAVLVVTWAWVGTVELPAGEPGEHHGLLHALRVLRRRHLIGLAVVFACGAMVEGGIDSWGVLVLRDQLGVGALVGAGGYLAGQAIAAATRISVGPRAGALGAARGVAVGGATAAAGLLLLALAPTTLAVVGLAVAAIGISVSWPLLIAAASEGEARPGPVVGGVSAVGYTGFVLGPPLVGWLAHGLGLRHALLLLVVAAGIVCVGPLRLRATRSSTRVAAPSGQAGPR